MLFSQICFKAACRVESQRPDARQHQLLHMPSRMLLRFYFCTPGPSAVPSLSRGRGKHTPVPPPLYPPPQFSLSLAVALGDERRLDQTRQLGQPRAIKTPVSVLRQRGQMGPTSTQTQTKGPHIHQGARPHLHPNEAGVEVEGSTLPSPR